jgi:hypothetical protein
MIWASEKLKEVMAKFVFWGESGTKLMSGSWSFKMIYWRRLVISPVKRHEYLKLELPRAWKPLCSSGPSPIGEGEEAQNGFHCGNQNAPSPSGVLES